jgi:hypothetical protein
MGRPTFALAAVLATLVAGPAWADVTVTSSYNYDGTGWAYGINYYVNSSYDMPVCVYPYVTYNSNVMGGVTPGPVLLAAYEGGVNIGAFSAAVDGEAWEVEVAANVDQTCY